MPLLRSCVQLLLLHSYKDVAPTGQIFVRATVVRMGETAVLPKKRPLGILLELLYSFYQARSSSRLEHGPLKAGVRFEPVGTPLEQNAVALCRPKRQRLARPCHFYCPPPS